MRLAVLDQHRLPARAFIRVAQLVVRQRIDPVAVTAMHRPELWGRPFFALGTRVLRGPSFWTAGEREYMALSVSRLNECQFCVRAHTETTRIETRGELDPEHPASVRAELAAVLPLLERMTTAPDDLGPADVDAVRRAGVPDEAIEDALLVGFLFNTVNRMGNAFDWSWDSEDHVRVAAAVIHRISYRLPSFVLR